MRIDARIAGVYLFVLALSFLAGVYFGSSLFLLFLFFLIFPIVSVGCTLISHAALRVHQEWDTAVPVRGDSVVYRLRLTNGSAIPATSVTVSLHNTSFSGSSVPEEIRIALRGHESRSVRHRIQLPHRGVFDFGMKSYESTDLLSMVKLTRRFESGRFFVFPRLYEIPHFSSIAEDILQNRGIRPGNGVDDPTLFSQLREYRDGESIRHISWRKYASTGKPYLREYEGRQNNGVVVYLDTRPVLRRSNDPAEQEDIAVEIVLALCRYFLERRVPVRLSAPGLRALEVETTTPGPFSRLYREAAAFHFAPAPPPILRYQADNAAGIVERKVVVVVSHHPDQDLVGFARVRGENETKIVLNLAGYVAKEHSRFQTLLASATQSGVELFSIGSAAEIPSVLGRVPYANAAISGELAP